MAKYRPYLTKSEISLIDKLKKIRIEKKITQEELAVKAGVTRISLAELEKYYKKPKKQYIYKIGAALEYPETKLDIFFESAKLDKIIMGERITPIPVSRSIVKVQEEFSKLSLNDCVFMPYNLIGAFLPYQNNAYAYLMPDDSMRPLIKKKDILIIKFSDVDFKELIEIGDYLTLALVNSKSGEEIIRNYRYNFVKDVSSDRITLEEPDVYLISPNREYDSIGIYFNKNQNWKIKGLVVSVISETLLVDPDLANGKDILKLFDLD